MAFLGVLVVPDATKDRRFADNDLVTGEPRLRFYAGALLRAADRQPAGTLCVLDTRPRELNLPASAKSCCDLAAITMDELSLRTQHRTLEEQHRAIEDRTSPLAAVKHFPTRSSTIAGAEKSSSAAKRTDRG